MRNVRKKFLPIILFLLGSFIFSVCTKDDILRHYKNVPELMGESQLTDKRSLEGKKESGVDNNTGGCKVNYQKNA